MDSATLMAHHYTWKPPFHQWHKEDGLCETTEKKEARRLGDKKRKVIVL
jgi:hypothetical protein